MHEMTIEVKVLVVAKPTKNQTIDYPVDYRREMERRGTYLGERDLGTHVAILEAMSYRDNQTIELVAKGMAAGER